jgi:hypothetical protein
MKIDKAYDLMFETLKEYYVLTKDSEVGGLLGELNRHLATGISNPAVVKAFPDGRSADPACEQDWVEAVHKVTKEANLTHAQALKASVEFLKAYRGQGLELLPAINYVLSKL